MIARLARRHHVAPAVLAALGQGPDVIPGQHVLRQLLAAVQAHAPVAQEQLPVRQRRDQVAGYVVAGAALHRDDGTHRDAGAPAAQAVVAATEGEGLVARVPRDHGLEVQQHGLAPGNPPQWLAGHVESENEWIHCLRALSGQAISLQITAFQALVGAVFCILGRGKQKAGRPGPHPIG